MGVLCGISFKCSCSHGFGGLIRHEPQGPDGCKYNDVLAASFWMQSKQVRWHISCLSAALWGQKLLALFCIKPGAPNLAQVAFVWSVVLQVSGA